jgi:hypothetical protein
VKPQLFALLALILGAAPAAAQVDTGRATPSRSYGASEEEGWLGMGIACSRCSYQSVGSRTRRWTFSEPPSVFSVDARGPADRAGLRAGDTLIAINGTALTSRDGGAAFGSIRPGQELTLTYRRDGREARAHLTAGTRPYRGDRAAVEAMVRARTAMEAARRAQERSAQQMQRQIELTQRQLERQREYMARVMRDLERTQAARLMSDSARMESLRRYMAKLDSAATRWRGAESLYAPPLAPSLAPMAPLPPEAPAPVVAAVPLPPAPPTASAWRREAGPLRYSGRLGDVIIEARGRGRVTATEVSDSEVVVTSGDISVRLALRPHEAGKTAPRPRAARPERPPEK